MQEPSVKLIAILRNGRPETPVAAIPAEIESALEATRSLYDRLDYVPPWISYLAIERGQCMGLCAFKAAPQDGRAEIAYMTAPGQEGRGVATRMARRLIELARAERPGIELFAQTLREENASVAVLRKLGFAFASEILHPEDGLIWEWSLAPRGES